jgi:integrase
MQTFSSLRAFRSRGQRKEPLDSDQEVALERLIGPERRHDGKYALPLRFSDSNPWKPHTRLRNWIGYRFARELGLRRGEVGKIRIDDIRAVKGHSVVVVRRRPHDPADTRVSGNRPKVKTVERELPISDLLASALRQYQHTLLQDGGRRGARTTYLLVATNGAALSGSSLDAIWIAVRRKLGRNMSWHVLRHTWAEEIADDLLKEHEGKLDSSELVLGILRELGGWTPTSSTPFLYIRNAMKKRGNEYLRKRNAKFDEDPR